MSFYVRSEEQRSARGQLAYVIRCSGEFDVASTGQFRECFNDILAELPFEAVEILIDLSGVTCFDSTALGAILRAHQRCRDGARPIPLVIFFGDNQIVARVFRVTGVVKMLSVSRTSSVFSPTY